MQLKVTREKNIVGNESIRNSKYSYEYKTISVKVMKITLIEYNNCFKLRGVRYCC